MAILEDDFPIAFRVVGLDRPLLYPNEMGVDDDDDDAEFPP